MRRSRAATATGTPGGAGGPTSPSARGARCARTTATTARPGRTSPTTRRARGPTAGARTAWAGSATTSQLLCLAFAFWNGRDPILKERIFGLTGDEGNHGEDAKEYWWYLDSTPTHSWMRWRYVYPQGEFPYEELLEVNRARGRDEPEYELLDTGLFDEDRYWDITVDYAKAAPDDICIARPRAQRRAGRRDPPPPPPPLVPQPLVVGPGDAPAGDRPGRRRPERPRARPRHDVAARRRRARAPLLRQPEQHRAPVERPRRALPEGRHQRPRRPRRARP